MSIQVLVFFCTLVTLLSFLQRITFILVDLCFVTLQRSGIFLIVYDILWSSNPSIVMTGRYKIP